MPLRIAAFALALVAVFFLGQALLDLVVFGIVAWVSLLIGGAAAVGAAGAFRASRRAPVR